MAGQTPFFSVIIPTYNRWPVVGEAVQSVLDQTFDDYELIVVDDGSDDQTCEQINKAYPNVLVLRQENRGVSAARNSGVAASNGEWIAFLDSDDLWLPEKLERQRETILDDPSIQLLHTDEIWYRRGKRVNPAKKHRKAGSDGESGDDMFRRSLEMCLISPSSAVIRREVMERTGPFDETLPACEDYDMWLRIMVHHKVTHLPESLAIKRNAMPEGHGEAQLSATVPAMDQYRVRSMEKLVSSGALDQSWTILALTEIIRKSMIMAGGLKKRGKTKEERLWREKARRAKEDIARFSSQV